MLPVSQSSAPATSQEIEARHLGVRAAVRRSTDLKLDTFTGDGSTTAFTLSNSGVPTNNAIVAINGVMQEPTTAYSISGTTLTFTGAVTNGDKVIVRYSL